MAIKAFIIFFIFVPTFLVCSALDMGGILSGNRLSGAPLGVTLGDGDLDVEGVCSGPGPACLNCTHAITCIALPVGWLRVPLQVCDEGSSCNARRGGCSMQAVPECRAEAQQFDHICEQVGIFPDAKDCRKFHMCSPPAGYPRERPADHHVAFCPRNYAYDALTAQCKIKLQYGQCEMSPVPDCSSIGQSGALPNSPNHYYVCLVKRGFLYPQVFVCPFGHYFYNNFCNAYPESVTTIQHEINSIAGTITESTTRSAVITTTTERVTDYPADTFLADKFDLSNYGPVRDETPSQQNSFEYSSTSIESY